MSKARANLRALSFLLAMASFYLPASSEAQTTVTTPGLVTGNLPEASGAMLLAILVFRRGHSASLRQVARSSVHGHFQRRL